MTAASRSLAGSIVKILWWEKAAESFICLFKHFCLWSVSCVAVDIRANIFLRSWCHSFAKKPRNGTAGSYGSVLNILKNYKIKVKETYSRFFWNSLINIYQKVDYLLKNPCQVISKIHQHFDAISISWEESNMSTSFEGLPWWCHGKEPACQFRRRRFSPWVGKILWWRRWQHTLVFLPGKSHEQRDLAGYSPRSGEESDTAGWQQDSNAVNNSVCVSGASGLAHQS